MKHLKWLRKLFKHIRLSVLISIVPLIMGTTALFTAMHHLNHIPPNTSEDQG